jgi:hypothetical protein
LIADDLATGGQIERFSFILKDEEEGDMRLRVLCWMLITVMPREGLREASDTLQSIIAYHRYEPKKAVFGTTEIVRSGALRVESVQERSGVLVIED